MKEMKKGNIISLIVNWKLKRESFFSCGLLDLLKPTSYPYSLLHKTHSKFLFVL